jgi:predicted transcriptional regulator
VRRVKNMRRVNVFLAILIASLASLIALVAIGLSTFTYSSQDPYHPSSWMSGMWGSMGGMMGQTGTSGVQNPVPAYFGIAFAVLVGVTVVGVGGLAYYLAFPEIRTRDEAKTAAVPIVKNAVEQPIQCTVTPYESVVKTLTSEERRVIEVLAAHDGKYLQKYIRKETGLSRLKTHRIVARLAERGIVSLEKTGNTNQVLLANWLKQP